MDIVEQHAAEDAAVDATEHAAEDVAEDTAEDAVENTIESTVEYMDKYRCVVRIYTGTTPYVKIFVHEEVYIIKRDSLVRILLKGQYTKHSMWYMMEFIRTIGEILNNDIVYYCNVFNEIRKELLVIIEDCKKKKLYIEQKTVGKIDIYIDNYLSASEKLINILIKHYNILRELYFKYMSNIDELKKLYYGMKDESALTGNISSFNYSHFITTYIVEINNSFSVVDDILLNSDSFKMDELKIIYEEYVQLLERCKIPKS